MPRTLLLSLEREIVGRLRGQASFIHSDRFRAIKIETKAQCCANYHFDDVSYVLSH